MMPTPPIAVSLDGPGSVSCRPIVYFYVKIFCYDEQLTYSPPNGDFQLLNYIYELCASFKSKMCSVAENIYDKDSVKTLNKPAR